VKEEPTPVLWQWSVNHHPSTKLAALDKIRKQVKGHGNYENGNGAVPKPILIGRVAAGWTEYAVKLKSEKKSGGQNFEMAELRVQDANSFYRNGVQ
jgi:hypothetical protein